MEAVKTQGAEASTSGSLGTIWWTDPSLEPTLLKPVPPNPLVIFNDLELEAATVALKLGCGRAHSALRPRHRQYFCGLHFALKIEKLNRDALKS